eukprot:TRINITY_DN2469_c0_g4_i11.p1 TRINITY_DN2469_c0_g4~~TRINITY_DN2469_c0_g4_i11.p1  ORF type:complete len:507 (-),score=64.90 TRINITY_DN2469_c0_g4_i11:367-1887(-)
MLEASLLQLHSDVFAQFLHQFPKNEPDSNKKYLILLTEIANRRSNLLVVEMDDLVEFTGSLELVLSIQRNTIRYLQLFSKVVDQNLPHTTGAIKNDGIEMLISSCDIPSDLVRRYELLFSPRTTDPILPIREVRSRHIGHLVTIKGIVIRVTEVKPLMTLCTYTCTKCSSEVFQKVTSKTFLPLSTCTSKECQKNSSKTPVGRLEMQTRGSRFTKYQELRLQEMPEHVPIGHIPRTIAVHVYGELTRLVSPGDVVTLHGVFLPVANEGFHALKAGLVASTYILAMGFKQHKEKYSEYEPSHEILEQIQILSEQRDIYSRLANSIAPEIFGHEDVKKALLLQMVGGLTRVLPDGMKIRGDIHICLMGDPGVAKSQLLKHISTISPRGVYTSGKGSSGVGLTAAIIKDQYTKELVLEGNLTKLPVDGVFLLVLVVGLCAWQIWVFVALMSSTKWRITTELPFMRLWNNRRFQLRKQVLPQASMPGLPFWQQPILLTDATTRRNLQRRT